jgi:hypothetical protein
MYFWIEKFTNKLLKLVVAVITLCKASLFFYLNCKKGTLKLLVSFDAENLFSYGVYSSPHYPNVVWTEASLTTSLYLGFKITFD